MSVGRICTREVDVAKAGDTVHQLATRMLQRWVGSLVVVNDEREPIGLVTDRDLVTRVIASELDPKKTPVEEVMTKGPRTVQEDEPIESVVSLMRSGGFRRIPVVSSENKLVGLVTLDDVLGLLADEFSVIGDLLARQAPLRLGGS